MNFKSLILLAALTCLPLSAALVQDVRDAIKENDFARGEKLIADYQTDKGKTPEMILALSWLGRGALAAKDYERAERYATETRALALEALEGRELDAEPDLPLALGASIEVTAQAMAAEDRRSEAVAFLNEQIAKYRDTSMKARLYKNLNLLNLEGGQALPIESSLWIGEKPSALDELHGRPVLMFLWAHWCGDCKAQGPVLEQALDKFGPRGLAVLGLTQRYGYATRGQDATPEEELLHMEKVRREFYPKVLAPGSWVSEDAFRRYGASTTPTLVLLDRKGIVRMFHPGRLTLEELSLEIEPLLERGNGPSGSSAAR